VFAEIQKKVNAGKRGYDQKMQREALYYLGYNAMLQKKSNDAMKYFVESDRISRKVDEEPSGFMVMTNLRMGMVHDLMGQHDYASKQYDKVLRMPDFRGSHDLAKKYKKSSYSR
jgi:TolA-binding protein